MVIQVSTEGSGYFRLPKEKSYVKKKNTLLKKIVKISTYIGYLTNIFKK